MREQAKREAAMNVTRRLAGLVREDCQRQQQLKEQKRLQEEEGERHAEKQEKAHESTPGLTTADGEGEEKDSLDTPLTSTAAAAVAEGENNNDEHICDAWKQEQLQLEKLLLELPEAAREEIETHFDGLIGLGALTSLLASIAESKKRVAKHGTLAQPPDDLAPFLDSDIDDKETPSSGSSNKSSAEAEAQTVAAAKAAAVTAAEVVVDNVRWLREKWAGEVTLANEKAAAASSKGNSNGGFSRPRGGSNSLNIFVKGAASSKNELKVAQYVCVCVCDSDKIMISVRLVETVGSDGVVGK